VYASSERGRHDLGQITILVASADFVSDRTLLAESDADIERTFNVNSLSPIWLIREFYPICQMLIVDILFLFPVCLV
jgi:short-subunit dehydrogenase